MLDEDSLAAGVILADWFGYEARRVYAVLGESEAGRARRELVELIKRHGGNMSARDVQRAKPKAFTTADAADAALVDLVNEGYGRWQNPKHTGPGQPPSRRMILFDGLTVDSNPKSAAESANTVNCQSVDRRVDASRRCSTDAA